MKFEPPESSQCQRPPKHTAWVLVNGLVSGRPLVRVNPFTSRFKDVESGNPCAPPEGLVRGETGTLQLLGANRISAGSHLGRPAFGN